MQTRVRQGFTLIEVLIVIAIISMIAIALFMSMRAQRQKADDADQISDIERLKVAFEDYYNDHNCYPPAEWFDSPDDCDTNLLSPYVSQIPCTTNNQPYTLTTDVTGCQWYQLAAELSESPIGTPCYAGTNYCAGSQNVPPLAVAPSAPPQDNPSAPPSQTPPPLDANYQNYEYYYCSGVGNCTYNPSPEVWYCSPEYRDNPNCDNTCAVAGSCIRR